MPDAWPHPQPCVQVKKARKQVTTGAPKHSGLPCAMVLTAYRVRAPVRPTFVSPSPRLSACLPQGRHRLTRGLAPATGAPGPHAFAVRLRIARLTMRSRPSHPASRVVTTARTPLASRRDVVTIIMILRKTEDVYFSRGGLTGPSRDCPTGKSVARPNARIPRRDRHFFAERR